MTYQEFYEASSGDGVVKQMTRAERTAWLILEDLTDRRGIGQQWDQIDDEIKDEIFESLRLISEQVNP